MPATKYITAPLTTKQIESFFRRVQIPADRTQCWIWIGGKVEDYGQLRVGKKFIRAHRLSYFLEYGVDPEEKKVLHRCDNPPCVNPTHLFLGTNAENSQDMVTKGRSPRGVKCARSKLNDNDIREIRSLYRPGQRGASMGSIATLFGVSKHAIWQILKGGTWKHVT